MTSFWWHSARRLLVAERHGVFSVVRALTPVRKRLPLPMTLLEPAAGGGARVGFGPVERTITLVPCDERPAGPDWKRLEPPDVIKAILGKPTSAGILTAVKKTVDALRYARDLGANIAEGIERVIDVIDRTSQPRGT